jgi:hypothetical protein
MRLSSAFCTVGSLSSGVGPVPAVLPCEPRAQGPLTGATGAGTGATGAGTAVGMGAIAGPLTPDVLFKIFRMRCCRSTCCLLAGSGTTA